MESKTEPVGNGNGKLSGNWLLVLKEQQCPEECQLWGAEKAKGKVPACRRGMEKPGGSSTAQDPLPRVASASCYLGYSHVTGKPFLP